MKKLPTLRAYGIRRGMVAMLLAMCLLPSAVSRVQAQTVPTQNLKLWLKADTGVTLNGTTVSKWADQSGNATDATQTNASLQPVLQTNAVNGRPALQFNGTNQYLGFKLPINGLTQLTMFIVSNNLLDSDGTQAGTENVPLFWGETGSWGCVYLGPFPRAIRFRFGTAAVGNTPRYTRPASIGTQYSITAAIKNSSVETLYVNGAQALSLTGKYTIMKNVADLATLGKGYYSYFKGGIAEVLVYTRALTDTERKQVEQYLRAKYLTASTATNQAPTVSAGAAQTIALPSSAALKGTASDDNLPNGTLTTTWSKVSGPGTVTFASATALGTTASFSAAGSYVLRLTASDGSLATSSDVTVTANPAAPAVSDPNQPPAANLKLWLKADAGLTLNGTTVSKWADQSGNATDATQTNASLQPVLQTNAVNGRPALQFNGTNQYLGFKLPINGLTQLTMFIVSNNLLDSDGTQAGTENVPLFWGETGSWGCVYLGPFSRAVRFRFGTAAAGNTPYYTRPAPIGTQYSITAAIKNSSVETLYVNGAQALSLSGKYTIMKNVADLATLGKGYYSYFKGGIAEVLVYTRAVTDAERKQIEQYLTAKYLSGATPVNSAPTVSAGSAQTVTLPSPATLNGTASDDNLPNGTLTKTWSKVSGPGTVTFSSASALSTSASFSAAGSYTLRLTASDGELSTTSDVAVTVNSAPATTQPPPPVTSGGSDVVFPSGSGVYNVKDYGARGDGNTDDTAAIKAAMKAALGFDLRNKTLYFPAGTYIVSDTLLWAEDGTTPAQVTANIDAGRGCITGFNIINGGHGYRSTWTGGPGVYLTGGGGSGASVTSSLSGDSVGSISAAGGCTGRGYKSAPTVKVVNWRAWFRFQGQNQATTVIKLRDYAPGFSNANCSVSINEGVARENCRAVVYTASQNEGNPYGSGESAYETDIWDMSIDTGTGNPGAIAVDWIGSNRASIRNVTLRAGDGAGRCGLNLTRSWGGSGGGPGFIKNLTVDGFDYGVRSGDMTEVGYTMEHVTLTDQRVYGLLNQNVSLWIRDLKSTNSVPAVVNQNTGSIVLSDAALYGGSSSESAILNQGSGRVGQLYARNVNTSGYQSAVRQGIGTGNSAGSVVAGTSFAEYTSAGVKKLLGTGTSSLKLAIKETPAEYVDNDFSHWAIVTSYGAYPNDNGDDTAGIQAALNSGKAVVFLPAGQYKISATLRIPSGVRKFFGARAQFTNWSGVKAYYATISCESKSGGSVEVRNIGVDKYTLGGPAIQNSCTVPFILADVFDAEGYTNIAGVGTGEVYMENVAIAGTVTQHGGSLWARQLDIETGNVHIDNDGATMWILGYKTEGNNMAFYGRNGGRTEILGAFNSLHSTIPGPGYRIENSGFSIASLATYSAYSTVVQETRNGVTQNYGNDGSWTGGTGFALFTAY